MQRGLYTAAAGMINQERKQAVVANNLANVNTTGYKTQDMFVKELEKATTFQREFNEDGEFLGNRTLGRMTPLSEVDEIYLNYDQGLIQDTDKNTDLAIEGKGFFPVSFNENEVAYTRNGDFKIDPRGYLVTASGNSVLGINLNSGAQEPIVVGEREMEVSSNGTMKLDGIDTYRIQLAQLDPELAIEVVGDSLYRVGAGAVTSAMNAKIYQGQLEKSNVNPLVEMVKMIEVSRSYDSAQKVIKAIDEMLSKAVNEVGRAR